MGFQDSIDKTVKLNNGVDIPLVGLGTYAIPQQELSKTIENAILLGYKLFDCAWKYGNEKQIGKALKSVGVKREDVFLSSMLNLDSLYIGGYHHNRKKIFNIRNHRSIRDAIELSFENLGVDYMDLFLVHYPWFNFLDMYAELTNMYHEGLIKAIGVCTCLPPHIEALKDVSDVIPQINQIEISPLNTQKQLIEYCKNNNIHVEAMSTFSHYRSNEPRKEILENDIIRPIAEKHNKSIAQIVLRWLVQQEITVVPKTWNLAHLEENISLFDFELSSEEMTIIDSLDKGEFLNYNPYYALSILHEKYRGWKGFDAL